MIETGGQASFERVRHYWPLYLGLTLWLVAIGTAYYTQNLYTPLGQTFILPKDKAIADSVWYGVAALLAVVGVFLIERRAPMADPSALRSVVFTAWRWTSPARLGAIVIVIASLSLVGASVYFIEVAKAPDRALLAWLVSLPTLAIGVALGARHSYRLRLPRLDRRQALELVVVIAIIALAVALRLPDVAEIPPDVHGDEAAVGLDARRILTGQATSIFQLGYAFIPELTYAVSALFMSVFGDNLYGLRVASVFMGTLTVLLLYLTVKRLFSARIAAVSAFLLAVSQWHIHYSRDGLINIQAGTAQLIAFYFMLRAIDSRRGVEFLLAGFGVGFAFSVYPAARVGVGLAGLYLVHRAISDRRFVLEHWPGVLTLVLGAVVFLAPMLPFYWHNPTMFSTRTDSIFFFSNQRDLNHVYSTYKVNRIEDVLRIQAINSALSFNLIGETSLEYGHRGPMLDFFTGPLFVVGLAVATVRLHRTRYFFIALWFWLTLITGSIMTRDAMYSPRAIGIIPVLFVFPAIIVDAGWRGLDVLLRKVGTYVFLVPVLLFLFLAASANYYDYFEVHIKKHMPATLATQFSRYIDRINDRYRVYLLGNGNNTLRYESPKFLLPNIDGVDVRDLPLSLPIRKVPEGKGVAFIVIYRSANLTQRLEAIKSTYPNGREELHKSVASVPQFYVYYVEHDSLLAANPMAVIDRTPVPGLDPTELEARK